MINSYVAVTDSPDRQGPGVAGRVSAAWRDRLWDISAFAKHVDDDFKPALGYVRRVGINHMYGTIGAHPRLNASAIQEVNPYVEAHYISNLDNVLETRQGTLGLDVTFVGGSTLTLSADDYFERIFEAFRVSGDATVLPGAYSFREGTVSFRSSAGRPLSGNVSLTRGGFWDGSRTSASLSMTWRADYRLTTSLSANHNRVSFPGTDFTADVYGAKMQFTPTTRLATSAFVQYNRSTDELITNLRLNFIHAPNSDLFLVYTERRSLEEHRALDQSITVKVTKLLVF
jgi:hypothetical protein